MRWVKELILIPRFSLMRIVSHFVILFYNYRGVPPERFRENWKSWIQAEQECFHKMNELPILSPAIPIMNCIFAGLLGALGMLWFQVSWSLIAIFLFCISSAGYIYSSRVKIRFSNFMQAILELPVYLLRIAVGTITTSALRLGVVVVYTTIVVLFLSFLQNYLSNTFLFYHLGFDVSLGFVLAFVVIRKSIYFIEILWNREKYFENMKRFHRGEPLTTRFFYNDILYSFFYGVSVTMFGTMIIFLVATVLARYLPLIDLTTPIGIISMLFLQAYAQTAGCQEYKFYTSHKFMHARPYYNIFHSEHHFAHPNALVGFGEAGYWEAVYILVFFGSLPGLSTLIASIAYGGNEIFHAYNSKTPLKKVRSFLLNIYDAPGTVIAAVIRFVTRSKSKGPLPMAYNPELYVYLSRILDVENIDKSDIEYEFHGQHHWWNVPHYGEGLTDYYMGKDFNN